MPLGIGTIELPELDFDRFLGFTKIWHFKLYEKIYDRIIENFNLAGKISKYQNILTLFFWINVMLRKLKSSGVIVLRTTN